MSEADILIVGSGPAGCTAAIYAVRAGFKTLVLNGEAHGGQLVRTHELENFPGFILPLSGYEVMEAMHKQCARLGVQFAAETVVKIEEHAKPFVVHCEGGRQITARAVIVASGSAQMWLGLESEKQFFGRGVSTCATCDGFFYRGKTVCVVGGGNKAFEEALFLTKFCDKVYIVHRRDAFRADKAEVDKARANPKIEFMINSVVHAINGDDKGVSSITVRDINDKSLREIALSGVFVSIGTTPQTDFLKGSSVKLTARGHVLVDAKNHTAVPGIFAAGDCADEYHNQAVIAAGAGAKAAIEAVKYLNERPGGAKQP
ncbi:MAG: thioredoxin-disulfide reductase [Elusimicrobiota bacterium]|jgi:thioredoxin reductase (NADPH)|nr:thioredoxin-disulfide reductase [Elusimicrobiota bacterium]